jgi:hypothetical protein
MDDEYLRSIRHWLRAEPTVPQRTGEPGQEPETPWIPLPRTPMD